MLIKKVFANILFNISGRMTKASTASYFGYGIEEMPESMKRLR
ncbi:MULTISPECIES: hypothetical protein [unclassified Clostridium]|nr:MULTISPECIES: hypothetical protein [unclassified Clostridium]EKQ57216.1 MAG: hypothetical protein A370_01146 [Clostridium sp. Maddingley MBC34-26]